MRRKKGKRGTEDQNNGEKVMEKKVGEREREGSLLITNSLDYLTFTVPPSQLLPE